MLLSRHCYVDQTPPLDEAHSNLRNWVVSKFFLSSSGDWISPIYCPGTDSGPRAIDSMQCPEEWLVMDEAREMFDKMRHRDEISWTTMVSGYIESRRLQKRWIC
ncbi:hypothetical protein MLD38_004677 [Melastoma candidum]|uniref:Uncharacterized protein n=1 Tax=Melastoma candidum TaxID=119954 RepID=A0ACB9S5Y9_9MYRT|nr:hypothetical protein MLD38_004677 [Melastoma candidum]